MDKVKIFWLVVFSLTIVASTAFAHVGLDYPIGGEDFLGNDVIEIEWHVAVPHGPANWDLFFSSDGGSNWELIVSDLPESQLTLDWTIPNIETSSGKIRIIQDNEEQDYVAFSGNFSITMGSGVNDNFEQIENVILYSAYPNPFNPSGAGRSPKTTISYNLPQASRVVLKIYNILGQEVRTLVNEEQPSGNNSVVWNGEDYSNQHVGSGVYFYKIQVGNYVQNRKLILVK